MKIKIYLAFLLFVFISTASSAEQKNISYGIQGGLTYSKMASLGFLPGTNIGVTAEKHLSKHLYINTAVCFTGKGGEGGFDNDVKARANYLSVPIHAGLKQKLSKSFKLFEEIGPYFSYGISGKTIYKERVEITNIEKGESYTIIDPKEYDTFSLVRRFNMGLGIRLGVLFKDKYSLSFGSDLSTNSLQKNDSQYINNHIINFGYVF